MHQFPGGAAVAGAVHATLLARREEVAEHRHVHEIRVGRMDLDAADGPGVPKSDVLPGLARIGRLVHADARRDVAARTRRPCPDVNHVGIRFRHFNRADGSGLEEAVRNAGPRRAGIRRLPDPAARAAHVIQLLVAGDAGDRGHAAAPRKYGEVSERQAGEHGWIDRDVPILCGRSTRDSIGGDRCACEREEYNAGRDCRGHQMFWEWHIRSVR